MEKTAFLLPESLSPVTQRNKPVENNYQQWPNRERAYPHAINWKASSKRRGEEGSGWGAHVCLWRIHFGVWQNQYNIVKLKKKKKSRFWCDLVQPLYHPFPQRVIHRETLRIPTIPWFRQQQHSRHKRDKKKSTEEINKNMDSVRQGLKQNKTHLLQSWNLTNHKMNREVRREELMWH